MISKTSSNTLGLKTSSLDFLFILHDKIKNSKLQIAFELKNSKAWLEKSLNLSVAQQESPFAGEGGPF